MATKFFIRVKTGIKSTIYFRYNKGREFEVTLKTPYSINPKNWDSENECYNTSGIKKNPKTPLEKNLITEISLLNNNLALLKSEVSIFLTNNTNASKEDIKDFYNKKYFPEKEKPKTLKTAIPIIFSDFIDYYIKEKSRRIEGKQDPITEATRKKLTTIKNRIILFDKKLSVKDINDDFRDDLTEWMQREKYSSSTIIKDLKYIKTVCSLASKKKIDINSDVLHWEFMKAKQTYTPPILSLSELKQIQTTIYPHDYLENAKDWIIIGFYTGARVSDLLSFDTSNIIDGNILKFSQNKIQNQTNDAEEYIWLHPEVLKVLEKRNNQFPRKISDVKLNLYIKEVCKIAGLTQKMIGGIKSKEEGGRGKKIIKEYEKWELITTHIFRRSFVTNFIEILGKENIKTQTGHKTDDMVNLYNKTEKLEKARRVGEKMEGTLKIS